jgi:hypothetical protein
MSRYRRRGLVILGWKDAGRKVPHETKCLYETADQYFSAVSRTRTKHSLLLASLQYYLWSILAGVLPRALQVGFVFAQPFLVDTTVSWIQDAEGPNVQNEGYGLIGAFAIVYIGIAVGESILPFMIYVVADSFTQRFPPRLPSIKPIASLQ